LGIWKEGQFAGTINATPKPFGTEIGYWLDKRFTGEGLATLSTRALALYLRGEGHRHIFACVAVGNTASRRVLERSNFFHNSTSAGEDPHWMYTYLDPLY
jgi:RimJ/RimL family protein N-acetyltransferase